MLKLSISLILILCGLSSVLWAQGGMVEVMGVKSPYLVVKMLGSDKVVNFVTTIGEKMTFEIEKIEPGQVYLIGVNNRIAFFQPVKGETVKIDASKDCFLFSGAGQKRNRFLYELCYHTFYSIYNPQVNTYMSKVMCPELAKGNSDVILQADYPERVKKVREYSLALLKKAKLDDKRLVQDLEFRIREWYWETLFAAYVEVKHVNLTASDALLKVIDSYDFSDPNFLKLSLANMRIYNYLRVQQDFGRVSSSLNNYIAEQAVCLKDEKIREHYVLGEIERLVRKGELLFLDELTLACESCITSQEGRVRYEKLKEQVARVTAHNKLDGVVAMDFEFENKDGKFVKLSDFKGKYVYIDLWATWCGPCKQEIPYLVELEKELKEENIVFVSVSLDKPKDKEKWKTFVKENNMHGVTLIAPAEMRTPFAVKYRVSAIPRFMLVDPEGKMVSNDCWRPREPRLKAYLLSLLKK